MARLRLLFPLLLIAVLSFAGVAQAQKDEVVSIGVRAVLADGDGGTDAFEDGATAYLYAFVGSEGDEVTISMDAEEEGTLDPFLVLLGPSGELIASNDDTEDGLNALIDSVELPESGTYLIMATSYIYISNVLVETSTEEVDQSENAAFTLALAGNTEPTDLAPEDALIDLTILEVGGTVDGEYTPENPVGYYVLNASAGDVISVAAESDDIDTILHVFSPFGSRIAVNDDGGDGTNSQISELELPDDGTYLIFATDVFFYNADDTAEAGAYTISVE